MLRVSVRGGSVTLGHAVPVNRTPCWSLLRLLEAFCFASRPMERVRGLVYLVFLTGAYRPPLVPAEASVELMRLLGYGIWAPWKNVTFFLKALAYIPSCDQTGVRLHFQYSTTSGRSRGLACGFRLAIRLSNRPCPRSSRRSPWMR